MKWLPEKFNPIPYIIGPLLGNCNKKKEQIPTLQISQKMHIQIVFALDSERII